ncbi:Mediator of RNA polymerase II transcription subunit 1-like isoform X1 [Aix galericulata]|nr:Mediator of RNA polymerase II transcription subunit 1-like isoform X1 [Aix galericulata]
MTVTSINALMEQLYLKYQQKPWTETLKLVHFCMDKPLRCPVGNDPDSPLLLCMEKIQRTLNAKSLFSMMNRLESLSRQKGLKSHVSPSGTTCYITSDMFYIEVQLEKDGNVIDAKLAHLGEAPVICDDLVEHLRMKNYDAVGKILENLSNLYQIPGNSEMKAKGYLALQSLEKDLYSVSLLDRTQDVNRVTEVLHGKVGHLVPRTGGTPTNIEFYISPYQILEAELNPGSQVCGAKIDVTVEVTDMLHKLPLSPLLDSQPGEDGNPAFLPLTDELSMDLSAYFLLKFHQPFPMSSSSIEEIQRLTGIPKHCYFINTGSGKSDLAGALVSKIPFTHPKCVPDVIEILRHQMAYNSLISSCVSEKHTNGDDSELLYFEVAPHKNTSFSVFFLHPMKDNLACVTIDVVTSREVQCSLHLNPRDPTLNSSDGFLSRAVKRCMSVPVVMRAIFRNAAKVEANSKMQVDTKQKPEPACEHLNSLEESPVAGHQDLVVTDKQSVLDSPKENLSTAKLETLGDNMEKSNPTVSMETLCGVEQSTSTASTEAVMKDIIQPHISESSQITTTSQQRFRLKKLQFQNILRRWHTCCQTQT